ncbi:MAG: proton-conducting transporter membrane subunit [Pseudomonadota bacterium]
MTAELVPLLIVGTTLAASIINFLTPSRSGMILFANLGAAAVTLGLVVVMILGVLTGETFSASVPFLPEADLVLQADALSIVFATLSALLWFVTTIYAVGYLDPRDHRGRFFGFFAICISATMGVALAGNLLTFLVFFELLTIATYPLVVHGGDEKSLRAGRIYLQYTLGGGAAFLLGTIGLYAFYGSGEFLVGGLLSGNRPPPPDAICIALFVLMVGGVGVKAALIPLHGWLPIAMVAPAPVSALLHAVAVVKTGAFGIVRIIFDVFGVSLATELGLLIPLAALAAATILWGSIRALSQDDLKRRLAYSTVSQVSYIALGSALGNPQAAIGGMMHLIHQGVMKITLFFCAGSIAQRTGIKTISAMDGLGQRMPATMAAFSIAAVGMIGLPPTAGFVTKFYVVSGGIADGSEWVLAVMLGSSALNAAYFLPILHRVWFVDPPGGAGRAEAGWMLLGPPLFTAVLTLAVALFATSVLSPLGWIEDLALQEFGFWLP